MQGMRMSALDPGGPYAGRVADFFWYMLITSALIYLIVVAVLLVAVLRRREGMRGPALEARLERRAALGVAIALGATVVVLLVTLGLDFGVGRAIASPSTSPLTIEITGNQWWWDVNYEDSIPQRRVTTANEIYIPTGRRVKLVMKSNDVIHSFWVPSLMGKRDLVPGYRTETWIQADRPGVYRGQCAEFCGHQHAKMGIMVVAVSEAEFAAWATAQRQPAVTPTDSLALAGQRIFVGGSCAICHNITGTLASGQVAPDLTHLASRRTIAAGTLPNTRGHLAGWIVDPQGIKPGVRMPSNELTPHELRALLAYLETLR